MESGYVNSGEKRQRAAQRRGWGKPRSPQNARGERIASVCSVVVGIGGVGGSPVEQTVLRPDCSAMWEAGANKQNPTQENARRPFARACRGRTDARRCRKGGFTTARRVFFSGVETMAPGRRMIAGASASPLRAAARRTLGVAENVDLSIASKDRVSLSVASATLTEVAFF